MNPILKYNKKTKKEKKLKISEKKLYNECPSWGFTLTAPGSGDVVITTNDVDCLNKVLNYMSKE